MASITIPAQGSQAGPLRPLNILHDLPQVADLIELCFASTIDDDGQSYLEQMRRASRDNDFLRWAGRVVDSAAMPLSGFVWETDGKIVGNASLVYQSVRKRKIAMIANVATHPDYRRRGIGRALTEVAMVHARQKGSHELWLQVRDDNPTAIQIYSTLGFTERARRTTYRSVSGVLPSPPPTAAAGTEPGTADVTITQPNPHDWPVQLQWLRGAHPDELSWYSRWDWNMLAPGLSGWLYRTFVDFNVRQWAAVRQGQLCAALSWLPTAHSSNNLWLAIDRDGDAAALCTLLQAARRDLAHFRRLVVEYPAGEMVEAIESAGFEPFRTLIWMRAGATS